MENEDQKIIDEIKANQRRKAGFRGDVIQTWEIMKGLMPGHCEEKEIVAAILSIGIILLEKE